MLTCACASSDARQNCEIHFPTATAPVPENPTGICSGTVVYIYVNNSKTTTEGTRIATVTVTHIPDWSLPVTITGGLELLNAAATDAAITSGSGESKPTPSLQNAAERGSRGSRLAVALAGAVALFGGWLV